MRPVKITQVLHYTMLTPAWTFTCGIALRSGQTFQTVKIDDLRNQREKANEDSATRVDILAGEMSALEGALQQSASRERNLKATNNNKAAEGKLTKSEQKLTKLKQMLTKLCTQQKRYGDHRNKARRRGTKRKPVKRQLGFSSRGSGLSTPDSSAFVPSASNPPSSASPLGEA